MLAASNVVTFLSSDASNAEYDLNSRGDVSTSRHILAFIPAFHFRSYSVFYP